MEEIRDLLTNVSQFSSFTTLLMLVRNRQFGVSFSYQGIGKRCLLVKPPHVFPRDTNKAFVWSTLPGRKWINFSPIVCRVQLTKQFMNDPIILKSVITCPVCEHQKEETMPTDACQYFYECEKCKTILKPLAGDCCVFCSYGTVKCPPMQMSK